MLRLPFEWRLAAASVVVATAGAIVVIGVAPWTGNIRPTCRTSAILGRCTTAGSHNHRRHDSQNEMVETNPTISRHSSVCTTNPFRRVFDAKRVSKSQLPVSKLAPQTGGFGTRNWVADVRADSES